MGFLHKLWDETLAGPTPETGLAKLRKYDSFAGATSTNTITTVPSSTPPQVVVPPLHDNSDGVSRSITILRTNSSPPFRTFSTDVPGYDPDSPSGRCSAPGTPTTPGTPGDHQNMKKYWTRRKTPVAADAFERAHNQTSPTVYDWLFYIFIIITPNIHMN